MKNSRSLASLATLLLAFALGSSCRAQLDNGGFELWSERGSVSMPSGWTTGTFGAGRVSYADHPSAVGIWNWYYYAIGLVAAGEWDVFSVHQQDLLNVRRPVAAVPVRLRGVYRYVQGENKGRSPDAVDSGFVHILATRWNPAREAADTVVDGMWPFVEAAAWTEFSIDLASGTRAAPDSIAVVFLSSRNGFCSSDSGTCCYLSLDDVVMESVAGVSVPLFPTVASRVAPNPAVGSAEITFDHNPGGARLRLVDERGAEVRRVENVEGTAVRVDCGGLPESTYTYLLEDRAGHPLSVGRLMVSGR